MQRHSNSFLFLLLMAFVAGIVLALPPTSLRSRVRRQNMKVRISTKGDTIVMRFLRPNTDTKLEGYIIGYGSSMFSKQFMKLPDNGQPYVAEFNAEPKYLIAVQPIPVNEVKKQCKGKVQLEKPLHLVIGSVTPTSVLLSWGTLLKTPYEGNIMNDCLEDGHYTVRYREKYRKWNYQTCPTSDTVIDNLKPNTVYEFGVQPNSKDGTGKWSKPIVHNISSPVIQEKVIRKIYKHPVNPVKSVPPGPRSFPLPPQSAPQNKTRGKQPISRNIIPQTTLASTTAAKQEFPPTDGPKLPVVNKQPIGGAELTQSLFPEVPLVPKVHPVTVTMASVPVDQAKLEKHGGHSKQMFQPIAQTQPTQPMPLQASPNPHIKSMPEPLTTSHPEPQTKSQPQEKTQPLLQTRILSPLKPEPHPQSIHQTTPLPQYEPNPQPTPKTNHQILLPTQLQLKSQSKLQAQVQPAPQPTAVARHQTIQSTPQNSPHIPETSPKTHTYLQLQPETHSSLRPQNHTEPQPKTPQTKSTQMTQRPNTVFSKSKPTTQSKPKPNSQIKQSKPSTKHRIKNQQAQTISQTHHQPYSPSKATFLTTLPPKEHPASGQHPKPQPRVQSEPQTRTQAEHSKDTPLKAVHKAPNLPEEGKPLPRPALATEKAGSYNRGPGIVKSSIDEVPRSPISSSAPKAGGNATVPHTHAPSHSTNQGVRPVSLSKTSSHSSSTPEADGVHHRGNSLLKPVVWPGEKPVLRPPVPENKRTNMVGESKDHDKLVDLKQGEKKSILKPFPVVTAKPKHERKQQTTTAVPAVNSSRFDMYENSSIFRPLPASEVDIMGKKRFVAPHVVYKTDKKPDEPCSITSSMAYFPDEEGSDQNVTTPPRTAPSNLTVVTVEGCPSFVILDWEKSDNETREYEVVSTTTGPHGKEVSVLTTNQTHTTVENLTPESNYEFKVTPKNELGTGPSSEPVTFSTESADPRVSEQASGKNAIWTQFPFKADAYSECNGKQYIKRTWYRKFVGIQLCNSLRYKIYLSDSLNGNFYNIGDQTGYGEDHCQFVDSFLDGKTGTRMMADQLQSRQGFFRALRHEPVHFGEIGGKSHVTYVGWYECGTSIPGKW